MYIITNTAMDFPDGAQRFNWCACDNTRNSPRSSSLAGLGDDPTAPPPLFDFSFWSSYLKGGGAPTAIPAAGPTGTLAAGAASVAQGLATYAVPIALAAAAYWFISKKGKRR
jgi:hypothetical protein